MSHSFDDRAATWDDDPRKLDRARDTAAAIRAAVPLTSSARLLDYGAGTGLLSQELCAHVGPITLADPSEGMRKVLATKVADGRLAGGRIWNLDLAEDPPPQEQFDLIATLMTLHHIRDLATVMASFAALLEPDGALCVIDLEHDADGSFHGPDFDGHHGIDRDDLTTWMTAAGFGAPTFERCHRIVRDSGTYDLFLAIARPATATPRRSPAG